MNRAFWKAGHRPTLIASFLYFDLAFMVWVLLGPLAPAIVKQLHLIPSQKYLMVATPILAGAVLRLVNGVLVDRIGPKLTGAIGQCIVMAGLATAWITHVSSYTGVMALAVVLGFAGASFAVALPLASRWYPPEHQGAALGIAGMGNSGTVLAALFAPMLALAFGWQNVLGLVLIPLAIVFVIYLVMAKDAPGRPPVKSLAAYLSPLRSGDAWWFMLFYLVTFGGFSGLASSLTLYFVDVFKLGSVQAGYCTAACVFAGSLVRPLGGVTADRVGGIKALSFLYAIAAALLIVVSFGTTQLAIGLPLFVLTMLTLGMGNGAVFQLVPQRFRAEIGVMTGLVGMAGGIGGFYLAASFGVIKQATGSYQASFLIFAVLALVALSGLSAVKSRWRTTWGSTLQGVRV